MAAEGSAQPPQEWSFERVEQVALENSPSIQSAQAALEAARAYKAFGKLPPVRNPVVNLRALVGKPDDPAATYGVVVGLPFDFSGKRRAWQSEASAIEAQAQAELEAARNIVRALSREVYVLVALGEAALGVAQESAQTAQDVLKRIQARFDANAATLLDVALAEREFGEAKADAARARRELVEARAEFRQILDLPPTDPVQVKPLLAPEIPAGLSREAAVAQAIARRREIAALDSAVERFRRADKRLRKEAVAPVLIAAEGEMQGNTQQNTSFGASVNLELPLIFRNQGERAVARGQANALAVERALTERAIGRQAALSFDRLETALAEYEALDTQASEAAKRTLEMTNVMLEAGAVDYFRLLSARRSAFELRARRVASLRDAWLSRIALERAVGGLEQAP